MCRNTAFSIQGVGGKVKGSLAEEKGSLTGVCVCVCAEPLEGGGGPADSWPPGHGAGGSLQGTWGPWGSPGLSLTSPTLPVLLHLRMRGKRAGEGVVTRIP